MNVDVLVDWAQESLRALDHPKAMRKAGLEVRQVEEKLGWLRKFAPQLRRWGETLSVIAATEITTNEAWNGCRSHLGATVQSVRQRIKQALHPEHNQKTLRLESG